MEIVMTQKDIDPNVRTKMQDILFAISIRELANRYFRKSPSWLYHKIDGIDGNGGVGGFTSAEKDQLRGALFDISNRVRLCAESL